MLVPTSEGKVVMKIVFVDIDGVLNNSRCYGPLGTGVTERGRNPWPESIEALNWLMDHSGALIVISSTWRLAGLMHMRETFATWGITGTVLDVTPRLLTQKGDITLAQPRGFEIAE